MTIHKIIALFLAMHSCMSSGAVFSFPEQHGILVKLVSPDKRTPLFYTKGLNVMQDFKDGYMVTAQYFNERGFYPVGIIVHNKSDEVVTISAASIGSQQCSVDDIKAHCLRFEGMWGWLMAAGVGSIWYAFTQNARTESDGVTFLVLLAMSAICIPCGFAVDGVLYLRDYDARAQVLARCVLNEDIIIKPGQKIIKYVLLTSHRNDGVSRAQAGVLDGLEFTVFNGDGTPRFHGTAQVSS